MAWWSPRAPRCSSFWAPPASFRARRSLSAAPAWGLISPPCWRVSAPWRIPPRSTQPGPWQHHPLAAAHHHQQHRGGKLADGTTGIISGAASLFKVGAGQLTLAAADTYTGNTNVTVGTLTLSGSGSLTGATTTSGILVSVNAALTFDNTGTNLADRLGDTIPIALYGGTINYLGNNTAGASSTETVAPDYPDRRPQHHQLDQRHRHWAPANIASNDRQPGRASRAAPWLSSPPARILAVNQPLNSTFNKVVVNSFGANSGLINGILPYATVQTPGKIGANSIGSLDFATTVGNSIAAFTNYAPNLASAGPTSIVRLSANETAYHQQSGRECDPVRR